MKFTEIDAQLALHAADRADRAYVRAEVDLELRPTPENIARVQRLLAKAQAAWARFDRINDAIEQGGGK